MVADLRYFNSLELKVDSLKSQMETQTTQFLNEIDRLSREYYYADHMNAILGVYTKLDEVTNLQCDYLKTLEKCECLEKELSKSKMMSKSFEALQKHAINLEINLQQCEEKIKNVKSLKENQSKEFCKEREQYFEIQDLKAQLQDRGIAISELKKLIDKLKGKSMDTKFEKLSVIRQPNAFKSQRPSILGKPTIFSDSLERKDFSKSKVIPTTSVSRPQLKSNRMEDKVMLNISQGKKQEVEDHRRNVKFSKNKMFVIACNDSLNAKTSNVNFICATGGKYVLNEKHNMCVLKSRNGMNSRTKMPIVVPVSTREHKRIVKPVAKPLRKTVASESTNQKPRHTNRKLYENLSKTCSWWYPKFTLPAYNWKPNSKIGNVNPNLVEIILFIIDSGCSKHMTRNLKILIIFVEKFLGTVKFGNDQIVPIIGYGDLVQGAVTIKKVYYVEGLNHNLFSVGQFCDADLEVAFWKSTCYIRDLKGNDLLTSSRGTDLYYITLQDTTSPNLICLIVKATSSQAWLWLRRLSHLNFDTINLLSKNDIVIGLPKLKFVKDHLCSSYELGKAKRKYTWTHFLRSKDETPEVLINFLRLVQRGLHAQKTRVIVETIHVNFDELPHMASDHVSFDPVPQCQRTAFEHDSLSPGPQCQENVPQADRTVTTLNELDLPFSLMFAELLNGSSQVVSKSSAELLLMSLTNTEGRSSRHVDSSNMHTFCQRHPSEHRWTKDHPLEQVIGNPSQSVRTRRQLESDGEMCMFALTVSQNEPKNIKEAMADSAWIESMKEELYQFDRLEV
uniref:Uncharacterized protein n=1 Tax=Tanacetum cinerariifolium TaxID=118510 RepID=A0A699I0I4_TANCI|nr:hypothetical protein [Tanacetum cinerariifolium]